MKIIRFDEIVGTDREVACPKGGFVSFRYLLESDGMGFSLHHTLVPVNGPQHWHYTRHLEACYCVEGRGEIVNLATGERHHISPGTCYVLDNNDDHTFEAFSPVFLISVFNPPVKGREVHQEDGSYE